MTIASGGQGTSKSKQAQAPLTPDEKQFQAINLEASEASLRAFLGQEKFQQLQQGVASGALKDLGGAQDFLNTISREDQAGLVQEEFGRAREGGALVDESIAAERERLAAGDEIETGLTDEQRANINALAEAELASGEADINRFRDEALEAIREEVGPARGLAPGDTPLIDRGGRVAREAINAFGQLSSDVRGREAANLLNFPLTERGLALQERQGALAERGFAANLGASAAATAEGFRQRGIENRLALAGQSGSQGLGLATGFNTIAAQAAQRPTVLSQSKSKTTNLGVSSVRFKDLLGALETKATLAAVRGIALHRWRYKKGSGDADLHVGPTAEDFQAAFGIGDGTTINYLDAIGVLFGALQELAGEVSDLKALAAGVEE
jgi:hypothetical protein